MWRALVLVLFLLGCDFDRCVLAAQTPEPRPNLIFILCDDLGWGDFGVLDQNHSSHERRHRTPMIDKMASEGMQLRSHYCSAPVCAPSRASLLTGVHQGHAEERDNQFDKALADTHTLGSVLRQAGYRTWMVGKYGLPGQGDRPEQWPAYPTKRGFDDSLASTNLPRTDGALELSGWLNVPVTGEYRLVVDCKSRMFLRVHEAAVIDADQGQSPRQPLSCAIQLKAGLHPVRLTTLLSVLSGDDPEIEFRWQMPGAGESVVIPADAWFCQ